MIWEPCDLANDLQCFSAVATFPLDATNPQHRGTVARITRADGALALAVTVAATVTACNTARRGAQCACRSTECERVTALVLRARAAMLRGAAPVDMGGIEL